MRHFGMLSGRELRPYGLSVDDDQYYEVQAVVLGYWTLKLLINPNPDSTARPIYASAYQRMPGKLAGYGLGQIVRPFERCFMASLRGLLENVGYSDAPLGEVDFSRIQRYMAQDQIGNVMAGTMVPTDPDITGGGRPAHYFHTGPNITSQLTNLLQYWLELVDRWTGLPAALSGQPIGTGVNRTFRDIMALYGNALKGVQSSRTNLDIDLFEPLGTAYFNYNMRFDPDPTIKGDAKVKARGTSGLLQKEVNKQQTQDTLGFIAQLAQTGQVSPPAMQWAIDQALTAAGVPLDQFPAQQTPAQPQAAQGGPPGASPQAGPSQPSQPQQE
ncbi:hypothetical protein AWB82_00247 [Caballeronia glebae]|uniref:Uncharacterized protein n=2 Tax=Caballeronia glebae TaxID=1777143 RepID=A0A157Z684_9BURK|nr:hypothetical protein AWB82_00247 [Caballeronia glebae]